MRQTPDKSGVHLFFKLFLYFFGHWSFQVSLTDFRAIEVHEKIKLRLF